MLLCVDGGAPGQLLDGAVPYLAQPLEWLAVHVLDTRRRAEIDAASSERAREVLDATEAALRVRGLVSGGTVQRVGEPGREICSVAQAERIDLIVLLAKRRPGPAVGPPSVGHTARFVLDHAPCPVLLLRGRTPGADQR